MVDVAVASSKIAELTLLKYFPQDEYAQGALVRMICEMSENDAQIDWLVKRTLSLYNEWPGPQTLRAIFCRRFKPADGIEANVSVDESRRWEAIAEPDVPGYPRIATQEARALPAGKVAAADPSALIAMEILTEIQCVKEEAWDAPATAEEIATAPDWLRRLEGYEN